MEKTPLPETNELYDVETLSAQSKMKYILEIFDLGKDKEKNEERKNNFMDLVEKYNEARQRSKIMGNDSEGYSKDRANIHNQIMDIITKMSLSLGLNKSQRILTEYLAENREKVSQMISDYYSGYSNANQDNYSELRQALRGDGPFQFSGKKEDD